MANPQDGPSAPPQIKDIDRDSLHILPLAMLPLQTPALRRARLIKNVRLETMVEFFEDRSTGSGQMAIESLATEFGWPEGPEPHPDLVVLRKLARLHSYDVYSLRISLRELDIAVDDIAYLKLSAERERQLTEYMTHFTRPLILAIYGSDDVTIQSFDDVIGLFRDPDIVRAREKLKVMAHKLRIGPQDLPAFLEDFGDIFLSLSYYRQSLDSIAPALDSFLLSLDDIRASHQLSKDKTLMKVCGAMESAIAGVKTDILDRFDAFDQSTDAMWVDISAEKFRQVQDQIVGSYVTVGGLLCALNVKMEHWNRTFPNPDAGGLFRRAEFILQDMRQGLGLIQRLGKTPAAETAEDT